MGSEETAASVFLSGYEIDDDDKAVDEQAQYNSEGCGLTDLAVLEREAVDLDAGNNGGRPRAATCHDVDDVETGQGGDHGNRRDDSDLIAQSRNRHAEKFTELVAAVQPHCFILGRVDPLNPGEEQHHAEPCRHPGSYEADGGEGKGAATEPRCFQRTEANCSEQLIY